MSEQKIHWIGAGLSSGPGIRRLARSGRPFALWNRTVSKAAAALEGVQAPHVEIKGFEMGEFQKSIRAGDIVVSMLPANFHPQVAEICLTTGAHLVTTSYVSEAMRGFDGAARDKNLCFVNESGLDPGIDHIFAHQLVNDYRTSEGFSAENDLSFISYCGGFPREAGDFKYKFSWSPIGVLRALKTPAKYIKDGDVREPQEPWKDLSGFSAFSESFEVYPNRDSVPYIEDYGFEKNWRVQNFVRGTIRLAGWSKAWKDVFTQVEAADPARLQKTSDELWDKYSYADGEDDRVLMYVGLEAKKGDRLVYSSSYAMDHYGSGKNTAMAQLVSLPAALAVETVATNKAPVGVSGATKNPAEVTRWMNDLSQEGVRILRGTWQTAEF